MSLPTHSAATLSVRLLWPFARALARDPRGIHLPRVPGIDIADVGNPDARFPHEVVMRALEESVRLSDNPLLGLEAGAQCEQADFDILEYAARSSAVFGDALTVVARYFRILHEAQETRLVSVGDHAIWRLRITDGVRQPPAANDFAIASSIAFSRRNTAVYTPPEELWFTHAPPSYAAEYERRFQTRVRFEQPYNAIVMHRSRLEVSMRHASPEMSATFELQARRVLEKIQHQDGLPGRVRWEIADQFRAGSVSMEKTARKLAMGVTTLRRKLEDEGTTFSDIVADLRRELAERHLQAASTSVSEIAFLLGFSDVRAFGRAFRRWKGVSPTEYRSAHRS